MAKAKKPPTRPTTTKPWEAAPKPTAPRLEPKVTERIEGPAEPVTIDDCGRRVKK